ncbi:MAG: short-chain dehydrogenase, partial [Gammaproteobacteria bacterium HGW-Gammaproteobacteria-5]
GVRKLAMYAATKSFAMTLGEGLWAEWKGQGVDVLNLLIGTVDTPTMRDAMVRQGIAGALTMQLAKAEDIAAIALRELPNGPTLIHPDDLAESPTGSHSGQARREHVLRISAESALFIGD